MKLVLYVLLSLIFFSGVLFPMDNPTLTKILMHSEFGSYNKVYHSSEYKRNNADTFSVSMRNMGAEYLHKNSTGYTVGAGFVSTTIAEGEIFNVNSYEVQPYTNIIVPYFFIGNDFGLWAVETGMSYYLSFEDTKSRYYFASDGSEIEEKAEDTSMKRNESYVLPNLMIRILPENLYHIKIRFARERFNAVDSLFNIAVIYPYKNHTGEFYISMPTHVSKYFPVSNRRFGLNYSYSFSIITVGITAGYLAYNKRGGGDGNMYVFDKDNFSYGFNGEVSW